MMKINLVTLAIVFALFGHELYWVRNQPWTRMRISGCIVAIIALILLTVARLQLGASFSVRPQATRLVTTGIYSYIRNPIYLFSVVFLVGLGLFLPSWLPVLLLVVVIPLQMRRARQEASVLEAAFREEYRAYRDGTWF